MSAKKPVSKEVAIVVLYKVLKVARWLLFRGAILSQGVRKKKHKG